MDHMLRPKVPADNFLLIVWRDRRHSFEEGRKGFFVFRGRVWRERSRSFQSDLKLPRYFPYVIRLLWPGYMFGKLSFGLFSLLFGWRVEHPLPVFFKRTL